MGFTAVAKKAGASQFAKAKILNLGSNESIKLSEASHDFNTGRSIGGTTPQRRGQLLNSFERRRNEKSPDKPSKSLWGRQNNDVQKKSNATTR